MTTHPPLQMTFNITPNKGNKPDTGSIRFEFCKDKWKIVAHPPRALDFPSRGSAPNTFSKNLVFLINNIVEAKYHNLHIRLCNPNDKLNRAIEWRIRYDNNPEQFSRVSALISYRSGIETPFYYRSKEKIFPYFNETVNLLKEMLTWLLYDFSVEPDAEQHAFMNTKYGYTEHHYYNGANSRDAERWWELAHSNGG